MNDRELLEYAAKAAGIELDCTVRPDGKPFYHSDRNAFAIADGGWFAPLTDDGNALRLAVKLRIGFTIDEDHNKVHGWVGGISGTIQYSGTNEKSVRYAIVKTAAEIGKQK